MFGSKRTRIHVPHPTVRRYGWRLTAICCAILFLVSGCGGVPRPAEEKPPPATVKWEAPIQGALEEWTELMGTTVPVPDRIARVTAPIEGRVMAAFGDAGKSPIAEGQRIEKGTPLVQLDPTVVLANLAKAEAGQEVVREEIRQAQYAMELAASEVERLRLLKVEEEKQQQGQRSLVSPVDRLKADYALKDAQSKLKGANGKWIAGEKELLSLHALEKLHTLTSPITGRVGRAQVVRGQTLSVGTAVAEVIDLDEAIDFISYVPPGMVSRLQLGQPVLTGGFDKESTARTVEAEGQIVYIADQAEPETGNFVVKIRFSNSESHLRANRVMRVRVLTKPGKECINLRESAIQDDEEVPTVVIVVDIKTGMNADGKEETTGIARRLPVVLGTRDRTLHQIEIVSLDDAEKDPAKKWNGSVKDALFVVEGGLGLQTGDTVKLEVEGE